jgi:hypothetical protein
VTGALGLGSCYPGDPLSASDADLVLTLYDPEADFSTKLTYAMPDTVMQIALPGEDSEPITRAYDEAILATVAENMEAAGYGRVQDPDAADVVVLVAVNTTDWTGTTIWCDWYWDYWWGYVPGWCYPVEYDYTTGTVVLEMLDPEKTDVDPRRLPSIWQAALNGVAEGTRPETEARIRNGIDRAFEQSPYLSQGKAN